MTSEPISSSSLMSYHITYTIFFFVLFFLYVSLWGVKALLKSGERNGGVDCLNVRTNMIE